MKVTQPLRVGLGLVVGLNPNTVTQCVWQQNLSICTTINDSQGFMGMSGTRIPQTWEEQHMGNFSMGIGKV